VLDFELLDEPACGPQLTNQLSKLKIRKLKANLFIKFPPYILYYFFMVNLNRTFDFYQ